MHKLDKLLSKQKSDDKLLSKQKYDENKLGKLLTNQTEYDEEERLDNKKIFKNFGKA